MNSQIEIQQLASGKLDEAMHLFEGGYYDGAFYLAGYCIELLFKAKVCKTLGIDDFFLFKKGKPDSHKPYKSHDFNQLMILAGLYSELNLRSKVDPDFMSQWSGVCKWDAHSRYNSGKTKTSTKNFLNSVEIIAAWIISHL